MTYVGFKIFCCDIWDSIIMTFYDISEIKGTVSEDYIFNIMTFATINPAWTPELGTGRHNWYGEFRVRIWTSWSSFESELFLYGKICRSRISFHALIHISAVLYIPIESSRARVWDQLGSSYSNDLYIWKSDRIWVNEWVLGTFPLHSPWPLKENQGLDISIIGIASPPPSIHIITEVY